MPAHEDMAVTSALYCRETLPEPMIHKLYAPCSQHVLHVYTTRHSDMSDPVNVSVMKQQTR